MTFRMLHYPQKKFPQLRGSLKTIKFCGHKKEYCCRKGTLHAFAYAGSIVLNPVKSPKLRVARFT